MRREASPVFQVYAADILADPDLAIATLEARGAHWWLMLFAWLEGSVSAEPAQLARLLGIPEPRFKKLWPAIEARWERREIEGRPRLVSLEAEVERQKQAAHRAERSASGRKGAKNRWSAGSHGAAGPGGSGMAQPSNGDGSAIAPRMAEPMANDGSASASASASAGSTPTAPAFAGPVEASPQNGDWRARFARFWLAYPRKVAKPAALKAFKALKVSEPMLDLMLSAIERQARSEAWREERGKFIPHPATWLHNARWDDEVAADPDTRRAAGPTYEADDGWFEECRDLHGGACNGRAGHRLTMQLAAARAGGSERA